jgi:hypothetical protein
MTLADLLVQLGAFARGELTLAALQAWLVPILAADPLDIEESAHQPWDHAADDTRLFWRLVYLFEVGEEEEPLRRHAGAIVACLDSTRHSAVTYELLPLLLDQDRFSTIVDKHLHGIISRTGFLNVVTESGYPPHAKLWLQHAPDVALRHLVELLARGAYRDVAQTLERRPPGR